MHKIFDSPFLWALITWPIALFASAMLLRNGTPVWVIAIYWALVPFTLKSSKKPKK
ncbi:MAG: hypothetical protein KY445_10060 [Armatimonadetes bacterium]|nr:hypothetical protein [Armatimonadota bacterium]